MTDRTSAPDLGLSLAELPRLIVALSWRGSCLLEPGSRGLTDLSVCYVRRKPGRGLMVSYRVAGSQAVGDRGGVSRLVSLILEERALEGQRIRIGAARTLVAPLEIRPSGAWRVGELGLSVQVFPADEGLPMLRACCVVEPQGPLFEALQSAARAQLRDEAWRLRSYTVEPVRYKPASRCVLRYRLALDRPWSRGGGRAPRVDLTLFGKVYADPERASRVQAAMRRLYEAWAGSRANGATGRGPERPPFPRPLGGIAAFGLMFAEAVPSSGPGVRPGEGSVLAGQRALRPRWVRGRGGGILGSAVPSEELRAVAATLSFVHGGVVSPQEGGTHTGSDEAERARRRAALIAGCGSGRAGEAPRLAELLAARLESACPDGYRPTHGAFKPSQLLLHGGRAFVVDFDAFGPADPALDVGYFLAYLRPEGLWYGGPQARRWFEDAAEDFASCYRRAMLGRGSTPAAIAGILGRARLYEAAALMKIACRRIHRLNSPRARELSGILDEIGLCLDETTGEGEGWPASCSVT